jgi:Bacterial regulatory proteins, gntR family
MAITSVRDGNASVRIADGIRAAILSGDLPPESRIRQEDVAAQFGASRIPVRGALRGPAVPVLPASAAPGSCFIPRCLALPGLTCGPQAFTLSAPLAASVITSAIVPSLVSRPCLTDSGPLRLVSHCCPPPLKPTRDSSALLAAESIRGWTRHLFPRLAIVAAICAAAVPGQSR